VEAVSSPAPPRAVVPVLAAAAGVVVAHAAGYMVAVPSAAERGPHLDATGHGYWPLAVAAAVVGTAVAVLVAAAGGAGGRVSRWRSLAGWQVTAFVVVELGERAVAGAGPVELVASPEFCLGLVLQVPVALLAARLLRTAERAGARMAAALCRRRPWPAAGGAGHGLAPLARPPAPSPVPASARPRGPPLALV